jgi:hypothetical protein
MDLFCQEEKKAAAVSITCGSREGCSVLALIIVSAIAMDNDFLFEKGGLGGPNISWIGSWQLNFPWGNKAVMMICAGTMINASIFINNLWEMLLTVSLLILYPGAGSCSAHSGAGYTKRSHRITPQSALLTIILISYIKIRHLIQGAELHIRHLLSVVHFNHVRGNNVISGQITIYSRAIS